MIDSSAADRRARWAVAAVFLANGMTIGAWAAHIPLVKERLGISHAGLGMALLLIAAGALVSMPLTGPIIARLGSAAVTRVGTFGTVFVFLIPLLAPSIPLLAIGLLLFGAVNGALDVAMNAHGVVVERRLGRPVMSSFHGMFSLGGLLGAGLAALLLPFMPPAGHAFVQCAVAAVLGLPALLFLLPGAVDSAGSEPAFALPNRATIGLGLLAFLALSSEGAVLDWSALHLAGNLNLGAGLAATGFAAFSATMAAGRFAGDWLRGHFGAVAIVRGSAFLSATGLTAALLVPSPALAIAGFAVVGLGMANLVPIFFGAAGRIPGQSAGTGIAAVATLGYVGFLTGPPMIGFVAEASSLRLALGLIVLACLWMGFAARSAQPEQADAVAPEGPNRTAPAG
jgi:MFS family permease